MSTSVVNGYSKDYGAQVHAAYQRQGTKLRNTVRTRNNVTGAIAVFAKVGKGAASTKARHGKVPVMNVDHQAAMAIFVLEPVRSQCRQMRGGYGGGPQFPHLPADRAPRHRRGDRRSHRGCHPLPRQGPYSALDAWPGALGGNRQSSVL